MDRMIISIASRENNLIDNFAEFLKDLSRAKFYGTVELQFVDGEFVLFRKVETFKPNIVLK